MTGVPTNRPGMNSVDDLPRLDARELRILAEWADGNRNSDLVIVQNGDGFHVREASDVQSGDVPFLRVKTTGRKNPPQIEMKLSSPLLRSRGPLTIQEDYDAAFWSQSAFEKFVLPYYTSLRTLTVGQHELLRKSFAENETLAILHMWPSRGMIVSAGKGDPTFQVVNPDKQRSLQEFFTEGGQPMT